ncbi:MAG: IgGFc-binding protein [Polyangiaceae bacterium]|nr:IgGFc-binding protein [Polyangiaceae bacterium]
MKTEILGLVPFLLAASCISGCENRGTDFGEIEFDAGGDGSGGSPESGFPDGDSGPDTDVPEGPIDDAATSDVQGDEQPDIQELACIPGLAECVDNERRVCDSTGHWGTSESCGSLVCDASLGCVTCTPFEHECVGNMSRQCLADGSGWIDRECDPLLGSTCGSSGCMGPCEVATMSRSYIGCEYYPTITVNNELSLYGAPFHFAVAVSNTGTENATVTVTRGSATHSTATIAPDSVEVIHLPWTNLRIEATATTIAAADAYRIRSTQPITVYQFNPLEYTLNGHESFTTEASLLIPVTSWGTRYIVASRNSWDFDPSRRYPGFYAVVASENYTTVKLTASATGTQIRPGAGLTTGSGTVVLNRGDVLQVLSGVPTTSDPTGTLVESDKPVQVIGGHACTFVPHNIGFCDHLEESMFPINTLAKQYFVSPPSLPSMATPKAFFVRVIAAEPNVTASFNPVVNSDVTLNNLGDFIEIDSAQAFEITATGRILVAQYMKGQQAGGGSGDPSMALAVTTSQFRTDYLFHSPVNYEHNYINIIAPDTTTSTVTLDGNPVSGFTSIGTSGYSEARIKFTSAGNGNHRVHAEEPVGVSVYGYGQYTSYWFPAGLDLKELPD